jgi:hypothetical protein
LLLRIPQLGDEESLLGSKGLAALSDGERPGRPHIYGRDEVLLVKIATEEPPPSASRWTYEAIARRLKDLEAPVEAPSWSSPTSGVSSGRRRATYSFTRW